MRLNWQQLACFRAIMACGTTTAAAEMLNLSQPSISSRLSNLEHQLGFDLFVREKGRLIPTAEAHHFHTVALQTLDSLDRAADVAQEIRNGRLGYLTIVSYPGVAMQFLPQVLGEFLENRPAVRVKLQSRSSREIRELFPVNWFDIGISELPVDDTVVDVTPLSFECVMALHPDHPLASEAVLTPALLDGQAFVSVFHEHSTYRQLAEAFAGAGKEWRVILETEYFEAACSAAMRGVGVAVLDPVTARMHAGADIVIRPFLPAIRYGIGILLPKNRQPSLLAQQFFDLLKGRLAPFSQ
ncbi:LysR substrate-binding domain-containing protein [Castellaniella sp. GW247-6E4]|uniref:LysR substrate-binding domain-containing protein n=1 Tax=Castellaniella sp. GW247-6E4 TaxID=3140380 RepID=UPI003314E63D